MAMPKGLAFGAAVVMRSTSKGWEENHEVIRHIHCHPLHTLWTILTYGYCWPELNSTVDKAEGRVAPGEKITVYAKVSPGREFPVKVSSSFRTSGWRGSPLR